MIPMQRDVRQDRTPAGGIHLPERAGDRASAQPVVVDELDVAGPRAGDGIRCSAGAVVVHPPAPTRQRSDQSGAVDRLDRLPARHRDTPVLPRPVRDAGPHRGGLRPQRVHGSVPLRAASAVHRRAVSRRCHPRVRNRPRSRGFRPTSRASRDRCWVRLRRLRAPVLLRGLRSVGAAAAVVAVEHRQPDQPSDVRVGSDDQYLHLRHARSRGADLPGDVVRGSPRRARQGIRRPQFRLAHRIGRAAGSSRCGDLECALVAVQRPRAHPGRRLRGGDGGLRANSGPDPGAAVAVSSAAVRHGHATPPRPTSSSASSAPSTSACSRPCGSGAPASARTAEGLAYAAVCFILAGLGVVMGRTAGRQAKEAKGPVTRAEAQV